MAWNFGDGFDLYAAPADMINGYWDSANAFIGSASLTTGRFAGSRALQLYATGIITKASNVNDPVHHFTVAFLQTAAIGGSTLGASIQLYDGATAQCSIVFRSDGAILLVSGGSASGAPAGTVLATYTGAFPVTSTWYAFEFEVVINNTAGSFAVRKNGNSVNDFSATGLNTRVSANNYANSSQLAGGGGGSVYSNFDDFYWRSGAASGSWIGDIRCFTRMPATDVSDQFSRTPPATMSAAAAPSGGWGGTLGANNVQAIGFASPMSGLLTALNFTFNTALTGHVKLALYDSTGPSGGPGALLATSAELTNPPAGAAVFSVSGGPTVKRGLMYWVALWADATVDAGLNGGAGTFATTMHQLAATYGPTFPTSLVASTASGTNAPGTLGMTIATTNSGCVADAQQDGLATYVQDNVAGHADLYGLNPLGLTPAAVIATTLRGYMQKSDAGGRSASLQLKSGGTTVATPTMTLSNSGFQWAWRTDLVDPNTGAGWTQAAVDAAQIGPLVVA